MVEPLTAIRISESLTSLQESIEELNDKSTFNLVPSGSKVSQNMPSVSICHEREFRVSGLDEYKSEPNERVTSYKIIEYETKKIEEVFDFLWEVKPDITNIGQLGKRTTANNRPRTMLIILSNPWAVRKVLSKAPMLKNYKPDNAKKSVLVEILEKREQQKEKEIVYKRGGN